MAEAVRSFRQRSAPTAVVQPAANQQTAVGRDATRSVGDEFLLRGGLEILQNIEQRHATAVSGQALAGIAYLEAGQGSVAARARIASHRYFLRIAVYAQIRPLRPGGPQAVPQQPDAAADIEQRRAIVRQRGLYAAIERVERQLGERIPVEIAIRQVAGGNGSLRDVAHRAMVAQALARVRVPISLRRARATAR